MTKPNINSKKGFTIIEVVLVLAIAGLIFLMVFIALPNLQRTQRDTQRRNDVDRLSASLVQYVANNNKLPDFDDAGTGHLAANGTTVEASSTGILEKFYWKYLLSGGSDVFEDPSGGNYNIYGAICTEDDGKCTDTYLQSDSGDSPLNPEYATFDTDYPGAESEYIMVIASQAQCGNEDEDGGIIRPVVGTRRFAVAMLLEGSGVYCVNN